MKILDQQVSSNQVMQMIDARLRAITTQYHFAVADDRKIQIEVMTEVKWQLAELKMQFCELLCAQIDDRCKNKEE